MQHSTGNLYFISALQNARNVTFKAIRQNATERYRCLCLNEIYLTVRVKYRYFHGKRVGYQ